MKGLPLAISLVLWAMPAAAFVIEQNAPPANPAEAFWAVYEQQDVEAAERTLEQLRAEHPDWRPSLELLNALERLHARAAILSASRDGDARNALERYQQRPQLQARGCEDPELRWAIARAHARLDQNERSQSLLAGTLSECAEPAIREGTIAVYADWHGSELARQSIERLREDGEISAERAGTLADVAGEAVSDSPRLTETFANLDRRAERGQETEFASHILESRNRAAANVFGWYWYRLERPERAIQWFQRSREWGANANAIEGLTRSRLAQNQPARAEAIARPWRERWESVAAAYRLAAIRLLDGEADPGPLVMQAITAFAQSRQNRELWLSLGWHYLDEQSGPPAIRAFEKALSLEHTSGALEGLVLAHRETGNREQASQLISENIARGSDYRERLQPLRASGGGELAAWFEQGRYARVIDAIDAGETDRDLRLMLAWSHYHLGNLRRAHALFLQMHQDSPTPETRDGVRETRQLGR
jgi:Tfp pilus assembly protein PilF